MRTEAAPVSREAAEEAVWKLLLWAGDDPAGEDLVDTPRRVANAYEEFSAGYHTDPAAYLGRTFEKRTDMTKWLSCENIEFVSHCEHRCRADYR